MKNLRSQDFNLRFQDFAKYLTSLTAAKVFVDFAKISKLINQKNILTLIIIANKGLKQDSKISKIIQNLFQDFNSENSLFMWVCRDFLRFQPIPPPLHGGI